jgi:hypothetical protein
VPIALLEKKHIENILAEKSGKPAAQRNLLRVLRVLLAFCVKEGLRKDNPALGIELKAPPTTGYHSWTERKIYSNTSSAIQSAAGRVWRSHCCCTRHNGAQT